MDIFAIKPASRRIAINIPGTGERMFLDIRPPTDEVVMAAQRRFRDRSTRERKTWTDLQERSAVVDFASAYIIGWEMPPGWVQHECTPENVRRLLMQADWLTQDLMSAAMDRDGFFVQADQPAA
jgi:hypothetical protein